MYRMSGHPGDSASSPGPHQAQRCLCGRAYVFVSILSLLTVGCGPSAAPDAEKSAVTHSRQPKPTNASEDGNFLSGEQGADGTSSTMQRPLSALSVEELLLSLRVNTTIPSSSSESDLLFKSVDIDNPTEYRAAINENRAVIEELRSRQDLPKEPLLKYRECGEALFTGTSGPYWTIGQICMVLLGENEHPQCEKPELPEL